MRVNKNDVLALRESNLRNFTNQPYILNGRAEFEVANNLKLLIKMEKLMKFQEIHLYQQKHANLT